MAPFNYTTFRGQKIYFIKYLKLYAERMYTMSCTLTAEHSCRK